MYRLAICEDDGDIRKQLQTLCQTILTQLGVDELSIYPFASAEALETVLNAGELRFDLLCLDIIMEGKTGMDLALQIRDWDEETDIIFISGSDDFLRQGYAARPLRYLAKPVDPEALQEALETALRRRKDQRLVTLRSGGKTVVLSIPDIRYIESWDHGIRATMTEGERLFSLSLTETARLLPSRLFCRCHNSFLVNMASIAEISRREIVLSDGRTIPVGRRYYDQTQSAFLRYLNNK